MVDGLDTKPLFRIHFICWRILGMLPPNRFKPLYWMYSFLLNLLVTVGYPLHLMLGLFTSINFYEIMQNLAINMTCLVCALKTFAIWWRFSRIDDIFTIIQRQDKRLQSEDEVKYLRGFVHPSVRRIITLFTILCSVVGISGELSVLVSGLLGKWNLMYKAYFPFDPLSSTLNYAGAHLYQFIGITYLIMQNVVNDTFAASHLALLAGQVHMLSMRVSRIGHDPRRSRAENNQELLECINDHKDLLEYRRILENVVSIYMFFQILVAGFNMCVVLAFVVLFVKDPFTLSYYVSYLISMIFEILPSCYYGTILEDEFQDVAYALFSCNWTDQNLEFKKNLRIFAEQAMRRIYVTAWMFRINNNAFIIACKNAYTLFALVMKIK